MPGDAEDNPPALTALPMGAWLDATMLGAAERLIDAGRIADVRVLQDGRIVTGVAHAGTDARDRASMHRVYIRYRPAKGGSGEATLDGECSCGEPGPCVHVAAVAISAAASQHAQRTEGRRPGSGGAARPPLAASTPDGGTEQRLCYVLDNPRGSCLLSVWVTQIRSGGRSIPAGACAFVPRTADGRDGYPRYVDREDREILKALATGSSGRWELRGSDGFAVLRQVVATRRVLWQSPIGATLRWGAARRLPLAWEPLSNGDQRLHAGPDALQLIFSVNPPVYIDTQADECGPMQLAYPPDLLQRYWNLPDLAPAHVAAVIDHIARQPDGGQFPVPRQMRVRQQPLSSLQGHLVLSAGPQATLHFLYNGRSVDSRLLRAEDATVRHLQHPVENGIVEIERNPDTERKLRRQLADLMGSSLQGREAWLSFLMHGVPAMRDGGWRVTIAEDFPYRLAAADEWYADLSPHRRRDWFDLQLGVVVDGQRVNLLPALVEYLQAAARASDTAGGVSDTAGGASDTAGGVSDTAGGAADTAGGVSDTAGGAPDTAGPFTVADPRGGAHLFVRLQDGRHLPVAMQRIRRLADTLVELFDRDALSPHQALSLPVSQAGRLGQLVLDSGPTLRSHDPSLLTFIQGIQEFSGVQPLQAPTGCHATLRPYQQEGLGWLQFLRRHRVGGLLADDMGLGKTVQTLAHLAMEKAAGRLGKPALIVAPVSVLGNWQREIQRFTPGMTALTLHGARRRSMFAAIDTVDIVVTGYPSLLLDAEALLAREFSVVILDEAQTIKNPRAKVSQAARALRAGHRLCLTGTPMENHLGDLWSLFDFVQPGMLGTETDFQRRYRTPIENGNSKARAEALARRIAPFLLRRTKDSVARDLPSKNLIVESIVMDDAQRDFYDAIRLSMHRRVREAILGRGLARSHITLLDALLKLRQACCDPRLLMDDVRGTTLQTAPIPSAKLDWLATALPELIADGRRILLFSQFTSMLRLIETLVTELSIPYCLLTGKTQNRADLIDRFQSGTVPLFLISLKAGGAGLNLTAADTVIHFDPWWNPAAEIQATDRAHRIGQDRPVFVYKLIARGTIEERILQLQAEKHALVSQLYTARNSAPTLLTTADIEALFAP